MPIETTPEDLLKHHIPYEIDMLNQTFSLLQGAKDQFLVNVLIESFSIHARNLIEFFQKGPRGGLIVARDFVESELGVFKGKESRVKVLMAKLNNQVAHLIFLQRTDNASEKLSHADRVEIMSILGFAVAEFKKNRRQEFLSFCVPDVMPIAYLAASTTSSATNSIVIVPGNDQSIGGPTGPFGKVEIT